MEFHTTGLIWNAKVRLALSTFTPANQRFQGVSTSEYKPAGSTSAAGAPPPPPPPPPGPPPPPPPPAATAAAPAAGGGVAAVFAELNRGDEVTKGLRKVDKSEMTHKNPSLRASSVVPAATCKRSISLVVIEADHFFGQRHQRSQRSPPNPKHWLARSHQNSRWKAISGSLLVGMTLIPFTLSKPLC